MTKTKLYAWLRRCTPLRVAVRVPRAITAAYLDTAAQSQRKYDAIYASAPNPWEYTDPLQQERYSRALRLLREFGPERFRRAAEIGCGEGFFTEKVATHCDHMLALDMSEIALERARARCSRYRSIEFRKFNVRSDDLEPNFNLVIAMDVLECLLHPRALRDACKLLLSATARGGLLLVSTTRQESERTLWSKWLLRGSRIHEFIAQQANVEVLANGPTAMHHLTLYRKVGPGSGPSVG